MPGLPTPAIPGLDAVGFLTNESVFSLTELPRRLAVIGAGAIGCELAQAFARFGSQVHLLEVAPRILINEDHDAAQLVARSLERDGVRIVCATKELRTSSTHNGKRLEFDSNGNKHDIVVDEILVGAGRAPNIDGLGLEIAGVAFDQSGVNVDDRLRTSNRRVFAEPATFVRDSSLPTPPTRWRESSCKMHSFLGDQKSAP